MKKYLILLCILFVLISLGAVEGKKPKLGYYALEGIDNVPMIKKQNCDFVLTFEDTLLWDTPLEEYYVKHAEERAAEGKKPLLDKESFEAAFYKNFNKAVKKQKKYLNQVDKLEDATTKYYLQINVQRYYPIPMIGTAIAIKVTCYDKDNPETPFFVVQINSMFDTTGVAPGRPHNNPLAESGTIIPFEVGVLIKFAKVKPGEEIEPD